MKNFTQHDNFFLLQYLKLTFSQCVSDFDWSALKCI